MRHYEEVARATDKPIVLYNIPQRTGVDMSNDLLAELAQIDGVSAVKQANNDNLALVDGLELYAGNDDILGRTLDLNLDPRHGGELLHEPVIDLESAGGINYYRVVQPVFRFLYSEHCNVDGVLIGP